MSDPLAEFMLGARAFFKDWARAVSDSYHSQPEYGREDDCPENACTTRDWALIHAAAEVDMVKLGTHLKMQVEGALLDVSEYDSGYADGESAGYDSGHADGGLEMDEELRPFIVDLEVKVEELESKLEAKDEELDDLTRRQTEAEEALADALEDIECLTSS